MGTQKQICVRITLETADRKSLADAINTVYGKLAVLDENGESLLLEQFDTNDLF